MLSVMGPEQLAVALSSGDTKALTTIPGIGAKSAERLVLELRDKVGAVRGAGTRAAVAAPPAPPGTSRGAARSPRPSSAWAGRPSRPADAVERVAAAAPADADIAAYLRLALRELRP